MKNTFEIECGIAERISLAAQTIMDSTGDSGAVQKAAGIVCGLADAMGALFSDRGIEDDEELCVILNNMALTHDSCADRTESAGVCRFHTAASRAVSGLAEDISDGVWAKAFEEAGKPIASDNAKPEGFAKAFEEGHETEELDRPDRPDKPEEPAAQESEPQPTPSGRRRPSVRLEPVSTSDIIIWSACRAPHGEMIPIQDLEGEFYEKPGRDHARSHSAAQNAMYKLERTGCAEIVRSNPDDGRVIILGYRVTKHGMFEAERLTGPVFNTDVTDGKSEHDLEREFGHLKEEAK